MFSIHKVGWIGKLTKREKQEENRENPEGRTRRKESEDEGKAAARQRTKTKQKIGRWRFKDAERQRRIKEDDKSSHRLRGVVDDDVEPFLRVAHNLAEPVQHNTRPRSDQGTEKPNPRRKQHDQQLWVSTDLAEPVHAGDVAEVDRKHLGTKQRNGERDK